MKRLIKLRLVRETMIWTLNKFLTQKGRNTTEGLTSGGYKYTFYVYIKQSI